MKKQQTINRKHSKGAYLPYFILAMATVLLALICATTSVAQNVLDGVYVKEQYNETLSNVRLNSQRLQNSWLFLAQDESDDSPLLFDTLMIARYENITGYPLKFNDCVFVNPAKLFKHHFEPGIRSYRGKSDALKEMKSETPIYKKTANSTLPHSLRHYLDTSQLNIRPGHWGFYADSNITAPSAVYLPPFYFRKHEVTNAEYREFVHYVRDSIAHLLLGEDHILKEGEYGERINWEKEIEYDDEEVMEVLEEMYLPEHERFYTRREFDTRKINYEYTLMTDGQLMYDIINVYPDTTMWVKDFYFVSNEQMAYMYFWHPAYNDRPVVGVSYHQAIAFLHWKTEKHNRELARLGMPYTVQYDLPTEAQWEMVATATRTNKEMEVYPKNYYSVADDRWTTDLLLKMSQPVIYEDSVVTARKALMSYFPKDSATFTIRYVRERDDLLLKSQRFAATDFSYDDPELDGQFHTHKADITQLKKPHALVLSNLDANGVSFMAGNVSEWLKDTYQQHWKPIFELRQRMLATLEGVDARITTEIERYFDQRNHPNGRLVRGSNWYDERYFTKQGKNVEGMNAKVFVSPDSAHCTLGFRYVVKVNPVPIVYIDGVKVILPVQPTDSEVHFQPDSSRDENKKLKSPGVE